MRSSRNSGFSTTLRACELTYIRRDVWHGGQATYLVIMGDPLHNTPMEGFSCERLRRCCVRRLRRPRNSTILEAELLPSLELAINYLFTPVLVVAGAVVVADGVCLSMRDLVRLHNSLPATETSKGQRQPKMQMGSDSRAITAHDMCAVLGTSADSWL